MDNEFKDLLFINSQPMWGLIKKRARYAELEYFDWDYISALKKQMQHPDLEKRKEAEAALIYLNAFALFIFDGNASELEKLGHEVTPEKKREIWNSQNARRRDVLANGGRTELSDTISADEAIDLHDAKTLASKNRHKKKEIEKEAKRKIACSKKNPKPCKTYCKEQIEQFEKQYAKKEVK